MTATSTPPSKVLANLDSLYSQIASPLPPVQFTAAAGARYNMGAGQPDPESLPKMELIETLEGIFSGPDGNAALMYGDAAGFIGLREVLAAKLKRWEGIDATPAELLIVNGSNHGLAIVAQAFLNVGDTAICEAPTFMGGLRPLRQLQAKTHGIALDDDGMRIDLLESKLKELEDAGTPAKLVYTIPNFHNPAGVNLSLARRHRLAELADLHNFVILEDDAYGELRICRAAGVVDEGRLVGRVHSSSSRALASCFVSASSSRLRNRISNVSESGLLPWSRSSSMTSSRTISRTSVRNHAESSTARTSFIASIFSIAFRIKLSSCCGCMG